MANLREEEERCVAQMNAKIGKYFDYLGVSEATKREFLSKANAMMRSGAFTSRWFHNMTIRLRTILQEAVMLWQVGQQFGNPMADEMNQVINEYLVSLGVSEAAKTEFASKANGMKGLMGAFNSPWFRQITHSLHDIVEPVLNILPVARHDTDVDLNETPPVSVQSGAVEYEEDGGSNSSVNNYDTADYTDD